MPSTHCIEHFRFEVDFDSAEGAFDEQNRTAAFARTRAPRILDEVFEQFSRPGQVWRFSSLEIDLGPIDLDELEAQWESRLRERLAEVLEAQQNVLSGRALPTPSGITHPAEDDAPAEQHTREQAQLDTLLHFLRRGHLPWHAPQAGRLASPMDQLAHEVLRDTPQALVAAWRASAESGLMVRRAVRQFSPTWLSRLASELARALGAGEAAGWGREAGAWVSAFGSLWRESRLPSLPAPHLLWQGLLDAMLAHAGTVDRSQPLHSMVQAVAPSVSEQGALWRALQAVARRATEGIPPAPTATLSDDVLRACLAAHVPESLDPAHTDRATDDGDGSRSDERARLKLRLQRWLAPQDHGDNDHGAWTDLLRADPSWARETLLVLGRSEDARRRMAQSLPSAMLHSLAALWLGPTEQNLLQSALQSPALWGAGASAIDPARRWELSLSHLLRLPSPALFSASDYLDSMLKQRSEREGRPVQGLMLELAAAWRAGDRRDPSSSPPHALMRSWMQLRLSAPDAGANPRAQRRARLLAALAQGALHGVEEAWGEAVLDDAPWLQNQLRHVGRSPSLQRQMAREWSAVARSQLIGLWLPAPDRAVVMAAVHNPEFFALASVDETRPAHYLWEHLLAHLLRLTPGTFFNADAYVRGLGERLDRLNSQVQGNTPRAPMAEPAPTAGPRVGTLPRAGAEPFLQRARLEVFLAQGTLPAATAGWLEALRHDTTWLKATLRRVGRSLPVRRRMAHDWDEPALLQLLALWWPAPDRTFIREAIHSPCFARLAAPRDVHAPATAQRVEALWEATLTHLLLGPADAHFDAAAYVHGVLQQEADELGLDEPTLARAVQPHLPEDTTSDRPADTLLRARVRELAAHEPAMAAKPAPVARAVRPAPALATPPAVFEASGEVIYIANAGMVLAGAYLERLFGMLGMARSDAFVSPASAKRAVHLLQYLATGEVGAPEPQLVLNKVLCGLQPETPMRREFEITPQESQAIDGLLGAMISHWKIIGNTTVAGLRESFLQREGHLSRDDDGWQLTVEERSFDMLLDQLPWGFSLLKFHWMERPLHVDWR